MVPAQSACFWTFTVVLQCLLESTIRVQREQPIRTGLTNAPFGYQARDQPRRRHVEGVVRGRAVRRNDLDGLDPAHAPGVSHPEPGGLTTREVIELIQAGRTNQEIADQLFLSLATVKDYNNRLFRKCGVRNRVELANLFR